MSNTTTASEAVPAKPKRNIKTFEPDPDVAAMLDRATEGGVVMAYIVNSSLRKYLTEKGFSRKRDPQSNQKKAA